MKEQPSTKTTTPILLRSVGFPGGIRKKTALYSSQRKHEENKKQKQRPDCFIIALTDNDKKSLNSPPNLLLFLPNPS